MATRKIFSAEVKVWATVYVVAEDEEEAQQKIEAGVFDHCIEAGESADFSGTSYSSPNFPDLSYSPAMTVAGEQRLKVELFEEVEIEERT